MIVCRLENWPNGDELRRVHLGEIRIIEDGGDREIGHYRVELIKNAKIAAREGPWRHGHVLNFKRQMHGAYDLLLRALIACIGGRNLTAIAGVPDDTLLFFPPSELEPV